jgi:hypothetical protein
MLYGKNYVNFFLFEIELKSPIALLTDHYFIFYSQGNTVELLSFN